MDDDKRQLLKDFYAKHKDELEKTGQASETKITIDGEISDPKKELPEEFRDIVEDIKKGNYQVLEDEKKSFELLESSLGIIAGLEKTRSFFNIVFLIIGVFEFFAISSLFSYINQFSSFPAPPWYLQFIAGMIAGQISYKYAEKQYQQKFKSETKMVQALMKAVEPIAKRVMMFTYGSMYTLILNIVFYFLLSKLISLF